jgi:hypothetical protein
MRVKVGKGNLVAVFVSDGKASNNRAGANDKEKTDGESVASPKNEGETLVC